MSKADPWFVYLVRCRDNSLYCGIAKDVQNRVFHHNFTQRGAKYTRSRRKVTLVYMEECENKSAALVREAEVKKLQKKAKEKLTEEWTKET